MGPNGSASCWGADGQSYVTQTNLQAHDVLYDVVQSCTLSCDTSPYVIPPMFRCDNEAENFARFNTSSDRLFEQTSRRIDRDTVSGPGVGLDCQTIGLDWTVENIYVREDNLLLSTFGSSNGSEEQSTAPAGYWSFNEGYGSTAYDSSSNQSNGTVTNATWQSREQCISGKCLYFDGTGDYVDATTADWLSSDSLGTISAWIKTSDVSSYPTIFSSADYASSLYYMVLNLEQTTGVIRFIQKNNDTQDTVSGTTNLADNNWHHVVVQSDGSNYLFYVDGNLESTNLDAGSDSGDWFADTPNRDNFDIGIMKWNSTTSYPFNGHIDEVKVYNYVRTQAQIRRDYNAGASGFGGSEGVGVGIGQRPQQYLSQGLVGYWKMDETTWDGTPAEVVDSSGNGNHGTSTNALATTTAKFGNAGDFNTSTNRIDIIDSDTFDFGSNNFTISGWAKINGSLSSSRSSIVNKWNTGASPGTNEWGFGVGSGSNKTPALTIVSDSTNYSVISPTEISSDEWHYIVGVRRDDYTYIYVDGVEMSSTYVGDIVIDSVAGRKLYLGNIYNNGSQNYSFDGLLDEIRIYNRALSNREIRDLYNWAPGPLLHLKMEEAVSGDSKTLYDSTGNGYDTTTNDGANNTGMDCTVSGKFGFGCELDGTDDYATIPSIGFTGDRATTFAMWVKFNSLSDGAIMLYGHTTDNYGFDRAGSTVRFGTRDISDNTDLVTSSALTTDTWYYLTGVYKPDDKVEFYIDGVLIGINNIGSFNGVSAGTMTIGNSWRLSGSGADYLDGVIDDVKIYDYARTPKQIIQDMNAGHPAGGSPVGSKLGYWKFDEGFGDTAYDDGFGDNDGDLAGTCPGDSTCPTWTNSGKFGKALSFDGSDDYVDLGQSSSFDIGDGDFTISVWAKPNAISTGWTGFVYLGQAGSSNGHLGFDPNNYFSGGTGDGSTWQTHQTNYTIDTNWHHYLMKRESDRIYFYVDGNYISDYAHSYTPTSLDENAWIGQGTSSEEYNGLIDEVKIYNYALTEDEVRLDYNQGSSLVLGSIGTNADGTASSSQEAYNCVPGSSAACSAPLAEFKFEEMTGSITYDSSGNSASGTITGAIWKDSVDCKYNNCLYFDGTDDFVDFGNIDAANFGTDAFSVSLWFKEGAGGSSRFMEKREEDQEQWYFGLSSGKPYFIYNAGPGGTTDYAYTISNTVLTEGVWYHLVAVVDRASPYYPTIYVNGVDDGTSSTSVVGSPGSANMDNTGSFIIGKETYGGAESFFNGNIDNVKIYNYARSASQVAYEYNRGEPVGWWKFDECEGVTAYDSSRDGNGGYNGNNGTLTNMDPATDWISSSSCKLGCCLDFEKDNDEEVNITPTTDIDPRTHGWSMSVWVKSTQKSDGNGGYIRTIGTYGEGGTGYWIFRSHNNSGDFPGLQISDGSNGASVYGNKTVTDGVWHHVIFTYDPVVEISKIYIDGILNATNDWSAGSMGDINPGNVIEVGQDSTGSEEYDGMLDDFRIYNYALTYEQVKQLHNNGAIYFN